MFIKTPFYILNWLRVFLMGRTQRVSVRVSVSEELPVLSCVPQGCVISPIMFTIYVNDILELPLYSPLKLSADDSKIYNLAKFSGRLQTDLLLLDEWFAKNKMKINISKTVFIRFGKSSCAADYNVNGEHIKQVEETKDLVIVVDRKLSFKTHCLNVCKKASFLCYNALRVFKLNDPHDKYFIFKTFIDRFWNTISCFSIPLIKI